MDHHDPSSHSHPSQSIPDAAYPQDSPYQPGQGGPSTSPSLGQTSQVFITPVSSHQTYTPSQSAATYTSVSSFDARQPPDADTSPASWGLSDPRAQPIPSSPPPPYDSTRVPTAYSPLGDTPNNASDSALTQPHSVFSQSRVEPASLPSTSARTSRHSNENTYPPPSPNPYSAVSSVENGSHKLGPVAEARRRRRRKVQICVALFCAIILFLIAVVVGVALGVIKSRGSGDDDDPGPPGSND